MKTLLLSITLLYIVNVNAQTTAIPDADFEQKLINLGYDVVLDGSVLTANISGVTTLDIGSSSIADLTGIEDFTALTWLGCFYNQLTSLDLSQNTALTSLFCYNNQLTSLDVSQNTALTILLSDFNSLTSLDVSQNTALITLRCAFNQLTSLDVSSNTALINLFCYVNQLTSLDVSQNTALAILNCDANQLTSLDVSQNTALNTLRCATNQLTSLDVSQNTVIEYIDCTWNLLTCLNVKNGNNANITVFEADNNPNLTCIEVDNVAWSNANLTIIDIQTSFSNYCGNACSLWTLAGSDLTVCAGESVTLSANNPAGALISWNNGVSDGVAFIPIGTMDYIVTADSAGFLSYDTVTVTVNPLPDVTVTQNGAQLTSALLGASYQWLDCDNGNLIIIGATNQAFTPAITGNYAVEVTLNGCMDTSACILVDFTGLNELNDTPKQLLKIVDLMGRETPYKPNTVLIYVYDDGTTERVFKMED